MSNLIDNHVPDFLLSPRFKFVRHFLLLLTLACITISIFANQSGELVLTWERFYGWVFYFLLTSVIIYFNLYVLAPRFLIKGRLLKYLVSMLLLTSFSLVCIAILQISVQEVSANYEDGNPYIILNMITSIISFGLLIFGTSALLLFKYWIGYSQRIDELASSTLQSELKFLKKQINPHFLFNMLNNANVLIKKNPEEASRVLFKLEDMLRYQINDSAKEQVLLSSEIHFLNDFLNLEKVRRDKFEYVISKEGDISEVWLPPLLFIPFVENAVKHNVDSENSSYVYLCFKVWDKQLEFQCINSKPKIALRKNEVGGLGLKNIKRRLELLFPERYTLEIEESEISYTVYLHLIL
jgi:hypothetical protein